jgi:hypothetical protein
MRGGADRRQALGLIFEAPLVRVTQKLASNGFLKKGKIT